MVNFNYRVGPYGFLASEKVRGKGDLNAGLLDERMAFKWVQEHIEQVLVPCRAFQEIAANYLVTLAVRWRP
jgi:hypothetical protein